MRISPRLALVYAAVIFGGPALPGVFAPQLIASSLGLTATSLTGDNELRAVYGGLLGGLTSFFALAALRPTWQPAGLATQSCVAGMVIARLLSFAGSGGSADIYFMVATEALGGVLAFVALRRLPVSAARRGVVV